MTKPQQFCKKPVVIEAAQFNNDAASYEILHWINVSNRRTGEPFARWENDKMFIPTLEGEMIASVGDWIIKGVKGEFYPCKPDIFEATYEMADAAHKKLAPNFIVELRGALRGDTVIVDFTMHLDHEGRPIQIEASNLKQDEAVDLIYRIIDQFAESSKEPSSQ